MTFYLFSMVFRSWGSVERGPTYFTCLLQIPVHHHSDIYSPILPLEEGYRIQAFSRYPYLIQHHMDIGGERGALPHQDRHHLTEVRYAPQSQLQQTRVGDRSISSLHSLSL